MLKSIKIKNFKGLKNIELNDLSRVNVLVGPNNSGKSSILHAIAFLAQSLGDTPHYDGRMTSLRSFEDTVFMGDLRNEIEICLNFDTVKEKGKLVEIAANTPYERVDFGTIGLSVKIRGGVLFQSLISNAKEICRIAHSEAGWGIEYTYLKGLHPCGGYVNNLLGWNAKELKEAPYASKLANSIIDILEAKMRKIYYFSPLRGIENWEEGLQETDRFGSKAQFALSVMHHLYSNEPEAFEQISRWASKLGVARIISGVRGNATRLDLQDPILRKRVNVVNYGFGVNQILSVIGQCVASPVDSVIMIEEPEIHLHPGAIGVLADLFVETGGQSKQLLLTTHSDRLVLELWARVKLETLNPADVRLFIMEKTQSGATVREASLKQREEQIRKDIEALYEPKSVLDEILARPEKSGDSRLSEKDLSEL